MFEVTPAGVWWVGWVGRTRRPRWYRPMFSRWWVFSWVGPDSWPWARQQPAPAHPVQVGAGCEKARRAVGLAGFDFPKVVALVNYARYGT